MGLHEVAIGGIFISPLLVFALLALPLTKGVLMFINKLSLSSWIWHEMLFICALYVLIFCVLTIVVGLLL